MEGSGSGSGFIKKNCGSGFGFRRLKNIRIRIQNTGFRCVVLKSRIRPITVNSLTEQLWEKTSTLSQRWVAAWSSCTKGSLLSTEGWGRLIELMWARNSFSDVACGKEQRQERAAAYLAWVAVGKEKLPWAVVGRSFFLELIWRRSSWP